VQGYACLNDVSARAIQFADGQRTRGKSIDTFCPIGPIMPCDQVGDPQSLRIACRVNGETVQDATTADMIFTVAELIAYVSATITLEPYVIATGTPPRRCLRVASLSSTPRLTASRASCGMNATTPSSSTWASRSTMVFPLPRAKR
jgi:2-keto-4-pentenoate hydratase/2-oxohepta-3-ene-1,7-dioic acid hydratase in catechol pathway